MHGLMGEYKDGQTGGWISELMDRHMGECVSGWIDESMGRQMIDDCINGCMKKWLNQ